MKNKLMIVTAAVAALVGLSASVQATPINGYISFNGSFSFANGTSPDLSTPTFLNVGGLSVDPSNTGGALAGAGILSFYTPIGVNANAQNLVNQELWSVNAGGLTYSFYVSSVLQTLNSPLNTTLTLSGNGTLEDSNGAQDNTPGAYTLTFGVNGAAFNFGGTTANVVPDGGATVMLLGAALSVMGLLRRKLIA
jgi:hypothetical protein